MADFLHPHRKKKTLMSLANCVRYQQSWVTEWKVCCCQIGSQALAKVLELVSKPAVLQVYTDLVQEEMFW
jgi:hypothetical protein